MGVGVSVGVEVGVGVGVGVGVEEHSEQLEEELKSTPPKFIGLLASEISVPEHVISE
jgi:hypothetical protein